MDERELADLEEQVLEEAVHGEAEAGTSASASRKSSSDVSQGSKGRAAAVADGDSTGDSASSKSPLLDDGGGGGAKTTAPPAASGAYAPSKRPVDQAKVAAIVDSVRDLARLYKKPTVVVEELEQLWRRGMIHPNSVFRRNWDLVIILVLIYTTIVLPFRVGFNAQAEGFWFWAELTMDALFGIDILLNFRTAFYEDGVLVTDSRRVAHNYLRTWFLLDFVATFPFDLIVLAAVDADSSDASSNVYRLPRLIRIVRLVRLIRLLRLLRLSRIAKKLQSHLSIHASIFKLAKMFVFMTLLAHLFACSWFFTASLAADEGDRTWATKYNILESSQYTQYISSLYWAIATITTVGYGDIVPTNDQERLIVVLCMVIGVTAFAYTVGTMSSLVQQLDQQSISFNNRMAVINRWLKHRQLTRSLSIKVRQHFRYQYESSGMLNDDFREADILETLPTSLHAEVASHLGSRILKDVQILNELPPKVAASLVSKLRPVAAAPGDFVCKANTPGNEVYLLSRGTVQVVSQDRRHVYTTLNAGVVFGEIAVMRAQPRLASVLATTQCDLFTINKLSFLKMLEDNEEIHAQFRNLADERVRDTTQQDQKRKRLQRRGVSKDIASVIAMAKEQREAESNAKGKAADPGIKRPALLVADPDAAETSDSDAGAVEQRRLP